MKLLTLFAAALAALAETPSELVGEWASVEGSNPNVVYKITADSRFVQTTNAVALSPGCDTRTESASEGRLTVEGGMLHLDAVTARFHSVNTCRPRWDYEKPGQVGRSSFRWRVAREGPVWMLVLEQRSGVVVRLLKR